MVLFLHKRIASLPTRRHATVCLAWPRSPSFFNLRRTLIALAIESSCDDTSVAVAELLPPPAFPRLKVHFHERVTANNDAYGGINPMVALASHHHHLGPLVKRATESAPRCDLVAATRGPGMRSNLSVGLSVAKGLACAWKVPFIGVHHMQAHALTPRFVSLMGEECRSNTTRDEEPNPQFPFLSLLVSGGHTMLINSTGLTEHAILAETHDIALGDCLDKAAREILPPALLSAPYGKALEDFAFPRGQEDYTYSAPTHRQAEMDTRPTMWKWALSPPLSTTKYNGKSTRRMMYSFSGLLSQLQRLLRVKVDEDVALTEEHCSENKISDDEQRELAREIQRVAFEHLASRIMLHLASEAGREASTVVVSGGVASNGYLKHILRSILDARGYEHIPLIIPPMHLCTDNALMIAWAAMEMYNAGHETSLGVAPLRKWSMDSNAEDGGILGASGWERRVGLTPHSSETLISMSDELQQRNLS